MSLIQAEQIHATKHFKVTNDYGSITIHSSSSSLAMFCSLKKGHHSGITICMLKGEQPYISLWPKKQYFDKGATKELPLALSADGLQVPRKDGTHKLIPFDRLMEILESL